MSKETAGGAASPAENAPARQAAPRGGEGRAGAEAPTFQDVIMNLQRFWAQQGCVVLQPYDNEVGAGTFHTATTLRSLGPDAWRCAYGSPAAAPPTGATARTPTACSITTSSRSS